MQNGGAQQLMQKMEEFCDKLKSSDLSKYKLSELLQNTHSMQFLINRCSTLSRSMNTELQKNQGVVNQILVNFEKEKLKLLNSSKELEKYNQNIEKADAEIQRLYNQKNQDLAQKKIFENDVKEINQTLVVMMRNDYNLKENMKQSKMSLNALENKTSKSKQFTMKLLEQIESISMKSWDRNSFIDWVLCINDGYFRQERYRQFIESIKQHIIVSTQMNELLLKQWGLTENNDINMFMVNYQRLMQRQSQIK